MNKMNKNIVLWLLCIFIVMQVVGPCYGWLLYLDGICCDFNWDTIVSYDDYLVVYAFYWVGTWEDLNNVIWPPDSLIKDVEQSCPAFWQDGVVSFPDVIQWDWFENNDYLCGPLPLTMDSNAIGSFDASGISISLNALLVAGKRGTSDGPTKLKDRLYVLDSDGQYVNYFETVHDRTSSRLLHDFKSELYQINIENGLVRLSDGKSLIPPGSSSVTSEPRYNADADVYVGFHHDQDNNWWGRPIMDAVFDSQDYVYVVPVVVDPNGQDPYIAAAKLEIDPNGTPPYSVVQLYDDPNAAEPNYNRNLNGLREIDLDSDDNLYVLNAHDANESDTLWVYDTNGTMKKRLKLGDPNSTSYIPSPVTLHVSNTTGFLYLASLLCQPDTNSCSIYMISKEELIQSTGDPNVQNIQINGMGYITGITEDPATGTIWVVGFTCEDIPEYPDPTEPPFYHPYLAEVPTDSNSVQAVCIGDAHDLAFPLSILWTDFIKCRQADLDNSGDVTFTDFAMLAKYWLDPNCASSNDCNGTDFDIDGDVDYDDFGFFVDCWLWPDSDNEPNDSNEIYPEDPNIIYSIVDSNGLSEITIDINDSITLYVDIASSNDNNVWAFDIEVDISDTNLGSIDNTEYPDGTAQILADPNREAFWDYWGPGFEQAEGIQLSGATAGGAIADGHLASFVFTCQGQGDITLELKNWASFNTDHEAVFPKLETIVIHQIDPNSP